MDEHPNAAAWRAQQAAMERGDFQVMFDTLDDDVEWHEIGNPDAVRGKQAVIQRWTSSGLGDVQFESHLHDVVANDDHTIGLVETTVTRGDKSITYRTAEIVHVRDGKITARWAFSDDTDAINRFFGS